VLAKPLTQLLQKKSFNWTSVKKLELPDHCQIHPVFQVSQLKSFTANSAPVFQSLSVPPQLDLQELEPELILDRRLSKRGNAAITQVLIMWSLLPAKMVTWKDYHMVKNWYPEAPVWVRLFLKEEELSRRHCHT
jgi:hypothetical protein